ncbi:MAG: DNA polymerase III subunit beta [Flavobacteriales bacterium]|nr:DNA polymerase III subunit beta [Flavobacteriales bacterium]|tara:strand:- start:659 stop:1786 length:1128 start_codon:yes stop_codon:yes gene_type:complete
MNFIISSESLLKIIQPVIGIIVNNPALPIIENILLELNDGTLYVKATDLETTIINSTQVESKSNASIAINAKLLSETLRTFPEQPLTFKTNDQNNTLEITSEQGSYTLSFTNSDEFPSTPEIGESASMSIDSKIIESGIKNTLFATGNDELRPVMSGVYMELENNVIRLVSTDAHKLVRYENNLESETKNSTSCIIPKKPLQLIKNIINGKNDTIKIEYNNTNIIFSFQTMKIYCRLIDGNYPNYTAVIPKENAHQLDIDRNTVLSSLKRVCIFSNQTTYQVKFKITGNEIRISGEDIDFSNKAIETMKCEYSGQDIEIGFNGKFLIEILNTLETEKIHMLFSSPSKAAIIKPNNDNEIENILMLVMPVMLNPNT